jgi:hypothetical protein
MGHCRVIVKTGANKLAHKSKSFEAGVGEGGQKGRVMLDMMELEIK